MSKRHVLSLVVLIVSACLSIAITPTHAQSLLDSLPNCNFTDAANDDNLLIGAVVYNTCGHSSASFASATPDFAFLLD